MNISRGALVQITAGKYKGLVMAVIKLDGAYIYVSDGRHRKLERLKQYNPKHVKALDVRIVEKELDALANKALWRKIQQMSVDI